MSKWTYIVYKKSGIQKDILAIQCQKLNLCNDTKPSNHLSYLNRSEVLIFIWNARVVIRTTQQNTHLMDHILSFFYQTPWKSLLISCQRNFSSSSHTAKKKITLHFIYTNLNIWIISQLKIWKYLAKYFLNIYFNAIDISSNENCNLKNSDL